MTTSSPRGRPEKSARWDKHIERLPEYAEKARDVIQTYRSSKDVVPRSTSAMSADEATRKLQRQAKLAVRERTRLQAKRRHAQQSTVVWSIVAAVALVLVVLSVVGVGGSTVASAIVGVAATALAVRSGVRLRELNGRELPSAPAPLQLPPATSSAHEPVQRLIHAQASLHELLTQLGRPLSASGVTMDAGSVAHAQRTAREAEQTLLGLASRIVAVERAAAAAPEGQRAALDTAAAQLRQQLDDGIESYGTLVAAAGQAVATSSTGIDAAQASITNAADHLAGMALALRELGA